LTASHAAEDKAAQIQKIEALEGQVAIAEFNVKVEFFSMF
jgi:hypothetical protein